MKISQKHNYLSYKNEAEQKSKITSYSTANLKDIHLQTEKTVMKEYMKKKKWSEKEINKNTCKVKIKKGKYK